MNVPVVRVISMLFLSNQANVFRYRKACLRVTENVCLASRLFSNLLHFYLLSTDQRKAVIALHFNEMLANMLRERRRL